MTEKNLAPKKQKKSEPVPVAQPNPKAENIIRESETDAKVIHIEIDKP
mgnify:FL=1